MRGFNELVQKKGGLLILDGGTITALRNIMDVVHDRQPWQAYQVLEDPMTLK